MSRLPPAPICTWRACESSSRRRRGPRNATRSKGAKHGLSSHRPRDFARTRNVPSPCTEGPADIASMSAPGRPFPMPTSSTKTSNADNHDADNRFACADKVDAWSAPPSGKIRDHTATPPRREAVHRPPIQTPAGQPSWPRSAVSHVDEELRRLFAPFRFATVPMTTGVPSAIVQLPAEPAGGHQAREVTGRDGVWNHGDA